MLAQNRVFIPSDVEAIIAYTTFAKMQNKPDEVIALHIAKLLNKGDGEKYYSQRVALAIQCEKAGISYQMLLSTNEMLEYANCMKWIRHCNEINLVDIINDINSLFADNHPSHYVIGYESQAILWIRFCSRHLKPESSYRDIFEKLSLLALRFNCSESQSDKYEGFYSFKFIWN